MFITFEGPEGAGKSTVIRSLADRIKDIGHDVVVTREPGSGEFGHAIRHLLLEGQDMSAEAELFLFLADRAEHVNKLILPGLDHDKIVLCDRHAESTVVYQGYARGLDIPMLKKMNLLATQGLRPDLILLLDLPPEVGLSRLGSKDRLDSQPLRFHQKVREGFLAEAKLEPDRWAVINAQQSADKVTDDCWDILKPRLWGSD